MPIFTPDLGRVRTKLGRPWAMWFTTAWWEAITLVRRNGQWELLETPLDEDLEGAEFVWQQRLNKVTYDQVRDLDLTDLGRTTYVDEYDDRFTDEFVSFVNTPFVPADEPEPINYPTEG